jgi:hypothetical protein
MIVAVAVGQSCSASAAVFSFGQRSESARTNQGARSGCPPDVGAAAG